MTASQTSKRRTRSPRGSGEQLRAEILAATTELLLENGDANAVAIRTVAQKVGVTSPSIYLHFADKDALLEAVVASYFERLDAVLVQASAQVDTPVAKLREQGMAYVRFALATPELYRIATMNIGKAQSDIDTVLGSSAFKHFSESVQAAMDIGYYRQGDVLPVVLQMWASAHGVAALMIAKPYLPWGDGLELAESVMRAVCVGQPVVDLLGGDPSPDEVAEWMDTQRAAQES